MKLISIFIVPVNADLFDKLRYNHFICTGVSLFKNFTVLCFQILFYLTTMVKDW